MSKHKNLFKVIGVTAMSALMVASMALPAGAVPTYTAINGTTTTLDKYLVMKNEAEVPNATFTFTIAPGTAIPAGTGTMEVIPGPSGATITSSVTFAPGDATTAEASKGDKTVSFKTAATGDEKFATKVLTADFSAVSFPEPGVYRYIVTENSSAQQGISNDTQRTRTLDVYVTDNNGSLVVSSYALHTGTAAPATNSTNGTNDVAATNAKLADKSTGFTNKYATQDLHINKEVTGNQGSKDKFFKFHVVATHVAAADKFTVDMTGATAAPTQTAATTYSAATMLAANTTQIVNGQITGQQLLDGVDFYLSDGEIIVIQGLPADATYTVTETPEDYKSTPTTDTVGRAGSAAVPATEWYYGGTTYTTQADAQAAYEANSGASGAITDNGVAAGANKLYNDATSGTIVADDIFTGYTNTRDGIIPTGVLMSVAPFAGIIGVGGVGAAAVLLGKKKSEDNED